MKVILSLLITISFLLSQSDKMYIGEIQTTVGKKVKTVEKLPFSNTYIIYGKFNGVDWKTGAINFVGNDGRLYSDPLNVQAITNSKNQDHITHDVLILLQSKKQETALANIKAQCEQNSTVKVMILPFRDDFYGLTEDVENIMSAEGCYNVIPNEKGLEYIFNNNLVLENLNDFTLKNIGKSFDVDYIIYGYQQ